MEFNYSNEQFKEVFQDETFILVQQKKDHDIHIIEDQRSICNLVKNIDVFFYRIEGMILDATCQACKDTLLERRFSEKHQKTREEKQISYKERVVNLCKERNPHLIYKSFFGFYPKVQDRLMIYDLLYEFYLPETVVSTIVWYFGTTHRAVFNHEKVLMLARDMKFRKEPVKNALEALEFLQEESKKAPWRVSNSPEQE